MPLEKKNLVVVDPAKFVIGHSDYSSITPAAARRAIRALIEKYNVGITPEKVSKDRAERQVIQQGLPERTRGMAVMEGITWVRCFYDATDNTGLIENGKAVVWDTVKGGCVTGINAKWGSDEYKIVGVALDRYNTVTSEVLSKIPVRLSPPGASDAKEVRIAVTAAFQSEAYPAYTENRRIFPIRFAPNPSFAVTVPSVPSGENPSLITGSGFGTEWAYNLSLGWVPQTTNLLAWTVNSQWYIEWQPPPFIHKELYEDLLPNGSAYWYATGGTFGGGTPSEQKVHSIHAKPGYKWPAGAFFLAAYVHPRYYAMKFFTCPVPQ